MLKKSLIYGLVVLLIVLSGLALRHFVLTPAGGRSDLSTQTFFAAAFSDADGRMQPMVQWQGQAIVVNFWATWCPPCLEEMPELSRMHSQYRQQGLVVLGISSDEPGKIREFAAKTPVSYPLLSGELAAMPLSESLGNNKGILPYTVIIAPNGSIAKTYFGLVNQTLLEQTFLPLLTVAD